MASLILGRDRRSLSSHPVVDLSGELGNRGAARIGGAGAAGKGERRSSTPADFRGATERILIGKSRADFAIDARASGLSSRDAIDAHRHMSASALTAGRYGGDIAKILGDANEARPNNDPADKLMDEMNNAIGREIANNLGKNLNSKSVNDAVVEKINSDQHWTVERAKAELALPQDQKLTRKESRDVFGDHSYNEPDMWERGNALAPDRDYMPGRGDSETYDA